MEKILVPTDFSENATNAVKYAIHFAQSTGKSIVFLNVTHKDILTSKAHDVYLKKVAVAIDQAGVELRKYINKIYKNLHLELNPLKVTFDVRFGHSAQDEIVVSAEKHKVSMIIMGTLGATGLKKFFVGSNTSGVIQNVNCSVLAIPSKIKYREIEKIGYSSNFENLSAEVKQLLPIVKSYNANLAIFSVYPVYPIKLDFEKFDIDENLKSLKEEFKYKNISLNLIKRALENDLEGGVAKFIKVFKPDMIIMFTQSRNWFERLLHSSATVKIVLNPKVPILSFKA